MKTISIGLKEFRIHLSEYIARLQKRNLKIIVLKQNKPLMEIRPVQVEEFVLDDLIEDISESRRQIADGDVYSFAQVCNALGYDEDRLRDSFLPKLFRRYSRLTAPDGKENS